MAKNALKLSTMVRENFEICLSDLAKNVCGHIHKIVANYVKPKYAPNQENRHKSFAFRPFHPKLWGNL